MLAILKTFLLILTSIITPLLIVFTNLGKSKIKGPDSIGSHYTRQDHDGTSGGYGEYSIIKKGRRGARMIGNFHLTTDEIIRVLVGQKGINGDNSPKTAGGGGGTFVVRGSNAPLIIAGGGGGIKKMSEQHPRCDASKPPQGMLGSTLQWVRGEATDMEDRLVVGILVGREFIFYKY